MVDSYLVNSSVQVPAVNDVVLVCSSENVVVFDAVISSLTLRVMFIVRVSTLGLPDPETEIVAVGRVSVCWDVLDSFDSE